MTGPNAILGFESELKNRQKHFVIVDGRSDFDALHSGRHNEEVQLYAFDMLAGDGDDMRKACEFGLEGLVSKRRDRPYRAGEEVRTLVPACGVHFTTLQVA
jgi:bifunctional non-homologous end joining protein LigD